MEDNNKIELALDQTRMAKIRTEMAFDRTYLTNTQSFLAYIRTALSMFAAGIGMIEFISNDSIVRVGTLFLLISPLIAIFGIAKYFQFKRRLDKQYETLEKIKNKEPRVLADE